MRLFAVVSLLLVLAQPAAAQRPEIRAGFSHVVPPGQPRARFALPDVIVVQDSAVIPKTRWLEGALIGGAVLGIMAGALAGELCDDTDSGGGHNCGLKTAEGFFLGAGLGFTIGGLIGGQIPIHSPSVTSANP